MPIPGAHLKACALLSTKLMGEGTIEIINKKAGPNNDMRPMEASGHKNTEPQHPWEIVKAHSKYPQSW